MRLDPLPIDAHVDAVVDAVRRHRAAVVVAPPGAGKTTRLPPALAADGPVLVLQPRRVAARAIARRIAEERGWTLGQEVGWHVRFERRFTAATRVLLATEGILTARLVDDPLISGVRTIVLDEFHERSIHACRASASPRSAWMERSWNSSSTIVRTPEISGSSTRRAVRMPSVASRMRVAAVNRRSNRTCQPTS